MNQEKSEPTPPSDARNEVEYRRQFFAGNKLSFAQAFWTRPSSEDVAKENRNRQAELRILPHNLSS